MSGEEPIPFDQAVWQVCSTDGRAAVQQGFEPEHVSGYSDKFLIQMLTLPSFTSEIGWQIYQRDPVIYRRHPIENGGKPRFIGCRTQWLQEEDVKRFSSPVESLQYLNRLAPTLGFQTVELDSDWLQNKLTEFRAISIAPFVESNTFGLDGERYEIVQKGSMSQSHFGWWGEGPDEWQPLTTIVFAMLEELEDTHAYDAATESGDESVPFDQVIKEIEQRRK